MVRKILADFFCTIAPKIHPIPFPGQGQGKLLDREAPPVVSLFCAEHKPCLRIPKANTALPENPRRIAIE